MSISFLQFSHTPVQVVFLYLLRPTMKQCLRPRGGLNLTISLFAWHFAGCSASGTQLTGHASWRRKLASGQTSWHSFDKVTGAGVVNSSICVEVISIISMSLNYMKIRTRLLSWRLPLLYAVNFFGQGLLKWTNRAFRPRTERNIIELSFGERRTCRLILSTGHLYICNSWKQKSPL